MDNDKFVKQPLPSKEGRPSLLKPISFKTSFRRLSSIMGTPKLSESQSPTSTETISSPISLNLDEVGKGNPKTQQVPFSPIILETRDIPVAPITPLAEGQIGGSTIMDYLGRLRSDSAKKRESNGSNGVSSKPRNSSRLSRLRQVVQVEEAEKINMLARLRAVLHNIGEALHLTEKELEAHLEDNDFNIDRAASDLLERMGLRQVERNSTLKIVNSKDDNPDLSCAWSYCDPTAFSVRCGPQYRKSRIKAPAKPQTLYDMVSVDMLASDQKAEHLSRYMKLGDLETDAHSHPLPNMFVFNFMLPLNEPRMWGGEANGETVHFVFVMKLSEWARQNPDHPSVQLAARFMAESGPNGTMRERLKIIVQVANPDELPLGKVERGLCRQYNGLPFLFRTYNSSYYKGAGWFQANFDGHRSGYTTRLARYSLLGWADQIVAKVAILVEAETDEEMPERILGCANLHRPKCREAARFVKPMPQPMSHRELASSLLSETSENVRTSHMDDEEFADARQE